MKKYFFCFILIISYSGFSQVGIGTESPEATLDMVAKNPKGTTTDPEGLLIPRIDRQRAQSMTGVAKSTLIYVDDISTGTQADAAINIDELGYYYFNGTAWSRLDTNQKGVPKTSIYTLQNDMQDYLGSATVGRAQLVVYTPTLENANGVTYDTSTGTFTFSKTDFYRFGFTYAAKHDATDCTISSYFVDFPAPDGASLDRIRIHTTASHIQGDSSNHGGTIVFAGQVNAGVKWRAGLGRGQSGNCLGTGMTLNAKSTLIEITSLGGVN